MERQLIVFSKLLRLHPAYPPNCIGGWVLKLGHRSIAHPVSGGSLMSSSSFFPLEVPANNVEEAGNREQFLRFTLPPNTISILPVNQMTEVLNVPLGEIVPIPQMPAWVMGVYNWRGEVLWLVDLGHLVGLDPIDRARGSRSYYSAIVIHHQQVDQEQKTVAKKTLGLIVDRVEDMEWCNPDWIQSSLESKVSPELVPFLRGFWLKENGEIFIVLDGNSIIANMPHSKSEFI